MIKLRFSATGIATAVARGRVVLAVGGVLTLMAAGCAGQVGGTGQAEGGPTSAVSGAPQIHPQWRSCAVEPSMQPTDEGTGTVLLPHLVDTFLPVAAVMCGEQTQRRPDGGTDLIAVEDRADEVTALLAALRLPDALPPPLPDAPDPSSSDMPWPSPSDVPPPPLPGPGDDTQLCTAEGHIAPRMVLLDGRGRWVRPGLPRDSCGKPLAEATTAMRELRWTRVSTRVIQEVESAEAAASGCSQVFTDMVWYTAFYPPTRRGDIAPQADDTAAVRLCVYRVKASEQNTEKPQGDFVSGGLLPPGRWAAVKREIQGSRPAAPCTTPADRFAVLTTPRATIHVELDNCRRLVAPAVLPGDGTGFDTIRQASDILPTLLTKP
ncbi:hypothetical protein [Actinoplanes xinjiangensis]|uniref:hypothetical protein n=1 Tax=Actinoplanes xinjiangensis TaxID=512350 RepID=UPI003447B813